jgi:hypothetical protein
MLIQTQVADEAKLIQTILSGDASTSWALFKYDRTLTAIAHGDGNVEDMKTHLDETSIMYGFARIPLGSERRDKFVLIKWIGDNVKPVQRAKAFDEVKQVLTFIKVSP